MIWCVEDDAGIRDIEVYTLVSTGFEARGFVDGEELFSALQSGGELPELVILDIMLPGEDGVELLKRLRNAPDTRDIPVIMCTAKGMEYDKIKALDLGADDYLVKPFGMMEMVSRVKAVLRRYKPSGEAPLTGGAITLNPTKRSVTAGGTRIQLTFKEFEILRLFMSHPGTVFTRDQLFAQVWDENFIGESRTVDMHIRTLRQKLGKYAGYIETVRGVGYRFETDFTVIQ